MKLTRGFLWTLILAVISALNGSGLIPAEATKETGIYAQLAGIIVAIIAGILQLVVVYKTSHSNPDGTKATLPYVPPLEPPKI